MIFIGHLSLVRALADFSSLHKAYHISLPVAIADKYYSIGVRPFFATTVARRGVQSNSRYKVYQMEDRILAGNWLGLYQSVD